MSDRLRLVDRVAALQAARSQVFHQRTSALQARITQLEGEERGLSLQPGQRSPYEAPLSTAKARLGGYNEAEYLVFEGALGVGDFKMTGPARNGSIIDMERTYPTVLSYKITDVGSETPREMTDSERVHYLDLRYYAADLTFAAEQRIPVTTS